MQWVVLPKLLCVHALGRALFRAPSAILGPGAVTLRAYIQPAVAVQSKSWELWGVQPSLPSLLACKQRLLSSVQWPAYLVSAPCTVPTLPPVLLGISHAILKSLNFCQSHFQFQCISRAAAFAQQFMQTKLNVKSHRDRYRLVLNKPMAPAPCPARPAARCQTAMHRRPALSAAPDVISLSRPVTARCGTVVVHPAASAGGLIPAAFEVLCGQLPS